MSEIRQRFFDLQQQAVTFGEISHGIVDHWDEIYAELYPGSPTTPELSMVKILTSLAVRGATNIPIIGYLKVQEIQTRPPDFWVDPDPLLNFLKFYNPICNDSFNGWKSRGYSSTFEFLVEVMEADYPVIHKRYQINKTMTQLGIAPPYDIIGTSRVCFHGRS